MFTPTSPITGAAVTGLTSPTYTLTADNSPSITGKQWFVSSLGGTQSGVDIHTISKPFTLSVFRPATLASSNAPNPVTGVLATVPNNKYKIITRKGAAPMANQVMRTARITTIIEIPAGTETYEPEELKAMISLHIGALYAQSSGIFDTVSTGVI